MTAPERCPQCGFDSPSSVECPRCGIVFAKVHRPSEPPPTTESAPAQRPSEAVRQPKRITLLPWLLVAVAVAAVVIGFDVGRTEEPELPPPSATQALAEDGAPDIDYEHCKGCMVCVSVCPTHAISAIPEAEARRGEESAS